jgi:putative ABC transport system permease protein
MRWIANLAFRLRATMAPGKMERELDDEMAFHIEMEARKLEERGMTEEEAWRQARRNFGPMLRNKESAREAWGIGLVQDLKADARYAFRGFKRSPSFAAVAILTLGLGIGGTTAIFSVVNGVILKPLPFADPHQLVAVHHSMPGVGVDEAPLSPAMYLTFRDHSHTLEDIGLWRRTPVTVTGLAEPEQVVAAQVTDGLFPVLGVSPILGRGYNEEDVAPGSTYPVILSQGYWVRRFGGDPDILGRTIRIDGTELTIIGVMPGGLRLGRLAPELYLPLVFNRARIGVGNWSFPGIARLCPGVTPDEASIDLDRLTVLATEDYPGIPLADLEERGFSTFVRPLKQDVVGGARTVLWLVFGTVSLVLLVACTNVANLFLVRAETRQRDVALRSAIGASRARLARQFITESTLIGILGGSTGLLLAFGGDQLLLRMAPPNLPRLDEIGLEPSALLFALGVSLLAGLIFGTIPILRHRRAALAESLKEGGRGTSSSRRWFRLRSVFAVSQVALVLVLLIGSGLMVRTFQALRNVPPGFQRPDEVLTFRLSVPSSEARTADDAARTHQQILERIARIPGVTSVGAAASVAMDGWESWEDVEVDGFPPAPGEASVHRRLNWVTPGYFATLENPLLAGRTIEWEDVYQRRPVAVVTENFAREFWRRPAEAVGKRLRTATNSPWREIVGIVQNEHTTGVAETPPTVIYWPLIMERMWGIRTFTVRDLRYAIRTSRPDPTTLLPEVHEAVWSVNSNLPLSETLTLDQILANSMARTSFTLVMLGIAAGVALLLGVVGVYGVLSYLVAQRTREMGVRLALGACPADVRRMVIRQGGMLGVAGVVIGLGAAAGLTRLMSALLFEVSPVDPLTYSGVAAALIGVVLLASYIPARRAAGVEPTEALRWE